MKSPFRFWMTGGAAMILAALSGTRALASEPRLTVTHVSRFSVAETVLRIEATAVRHGLPVLARLRQPTQDPLESRLVIVLESSQGGTPVLMDTPNARPGLLLSVIVQATLDGTIEVLLPEDALTALADLPDQLTPELRHDLADLPLVLDEALAA